MVLLIILIFLFMAFIIFTLWCCTKISSECSREEEKESTKEGVTNGRKWKMLHSNRSF